MIAPRVKLKPIHSRQLHESRFEAVLSCGMKLIFAPRAGFTKKVAFAVADFGSVDNTWQAGGKTHHVPDGIAHFLEHQVFKKQAGDLSDLFARRGAYINAHTGHTQTAYFFECVDNFEANLDNLLELVLTPWFDKKLVDTERQIINQEINQYLDQSSWMGFQKLMEALYVKHPVRIDIAGSIDSVANITPELLGQCHSTFYHPTNLALVISGDFEAEKLLHVAEKLSDKWAPDTPPPDIKRVRPDEPSHVCHNRIKHYMTVTRERLMIGFKDVGRLKGDDLARRDVLTSIGLDAIFSKEGEAYDRLYKARLVGGDFGGGYQAENSFGFAIIGGETPNAARLEAEVHKELARVRKQGIDPDVLERKRRKYLGQFLRAFNEPEGTAYAYIGALSQRNELYYVPGMIEKATVKQVNRRLNDLLDPDNYAVAVIYPQPRK